MEDIHKFRLFNKLKSVYRMSSVDDRKESSAEHSWACLVLADFFLSNYDFDLDKLKVYELLLYHDVVEIEAGDAPLHPNIRNADKKVKELKAAEKLKDVLPSPLNDKFFRLFEEFEAQGSKEAKFAKAIDALEAEIHELDYKFDWKGWSKDFLLRSKEKYFVEFPELKEVFDGLLVFLEDNGYFNQ